MSISRSIIRKSLSTNLREQPIKEKPNKDIVCLHCKRTTSNNVKCKGICVSDSDY